MIGQLIGGLVVGIIARLIMPGKEAFPAGIIGWILTAVLGIGGAFVGTYVGGMVFSDNYAAGWIMSILGALLLLVIVRMIFGKGGSSS